MSAAAALNSSSGAAGPPPPSSVLHMRLALTVTHLLLVCVGSVNLLVVFVILLKPYMRSITNVYMISLCLADFIYLTNLTLVAATQLNQKSWPFSSFLCTMYHGTETTGKYASVMFVVLLAVDRYCAMCRTNWCARYRNYRTAVLVSVAAWLFSLFSAGPLYYFAEVLQGTRPHCIAKWPSWDIARWYIKVSSVLIFALPLVVIVFCYYHILNKLREALKSCKRMKRGASSRAPYHRVTRLVLWVVVFHVLCWSPFWLFNLFSSIFRPSIDTQFDRIVVNIIHLFPYINCALNPILYVAHAENFRLAFRSLCCGKLQGGRRTQLLDDSRGVAGCGTTQAGGSSILNGTSVCAGTGAPFFHNSGSERTLLNTAPSSRAVSTAVSNGFAGSGGSAPSLLLGCPKPSLRYNSAKHSVITLDDPLLERQISTRPTKRRRSSATEQGLICGGGLAASSALPFVSQVIQEEEQKRASMEQQSSLLDQINAAEELPGARRDEKRTSVCFLSMGMAAGTLGGGGCPLGQKATEQRKYGWPEGEEEQQEQQGEEGDGLDLGNEHDEFI